MVKPLINAVHHWWPRTLSSYWADATGSVHRLTADGELVTAPPKQFGGVRNDNNIRFADVPTNWDESFESSYDKADGSFANVVDWLLTLTSLVSSDEGFAQRLTPLVITEEQHAALAECLASLIVRSPNFRNGVRRTTEYYRERIGLKEPAADKNLIGLNVRHGQRTLADTMARSGKFLILRAGPGEFIFGDGFFHNIPSVANEPLVPRCIIPLSPEIAVFYTRPMQYSSYPKAFVMNLRLEEVAFLNLCVQIYSARYLFYRNIAPVIDPEFQRGEHRQFGYDEHPSIAALEQAISRTRFGPDGQFQTQPRGI